MVPVHGPMPSLCEERFSPTYRSSFKGAVGGVYVWGGGDYGTFQVRIRDSSYPEVPVPDSLKSFFSFNHYSHAA